MLKVLCKATSKLKNYFWYKDLIPKTLISNCVYKFSCGSFTAKAKPTDTWK